MRRNKYAMSPASGDILAYLPEVPTISRPNIEFNDVDIMDAMCINCHEMIKLEIIEEHSKI